MEVRRRNAGNNYSDDNTDNDDDDDDELRYYQNKSASSSRSSYYYNYAPFIRPCIAVVVVMVVVCCCSALWFYVSSSGSFGGRQPSTTTTTTNTTTTQTHDFSVTENKNASSPTFDMEHLNLKDGISCGFYKCFFRQKKRNDTSSTMSDNDDDDDDDIGYLLSKTSNSYESMLNAWKLANHMSSTFGPDNVRHLLINPPQKIILTEKQANNLTDAVKKFARRTRFRGNSTITVQKVKIAPQPAILFGTDTRKYRLFQEELENFLTDNVFVVSSDNNTKTTLFAQNIVKNLNLTTTIVKWNGCLTGDFQVLIDTEGNFWHLDLDRCFQRNMEERSYQEQFRYLWDKVAPFLDSSSSFSLSIEKRK